MSIHRKFMGSGSAPGSPGPLVDLDASANPNYPAAAKGARYRITVAGKVGGASGKTVEAGDVVEAIAANAGGTEASVGTSWIVLQANIAGMTAAGLAMIQAANAAAQQVLLGITGGGAISTGGFTLTVPATGTAALLGAANVFTAAQTINSGSDVATNLRILNAAGTQPRVQMGTLASSTGYGAVYLGNITPGATNYAFISDGTTSYFNAAGSNIYFTHAGVNTAVLNASTGLLFLTANPSISWLNDLFIYRAGAASLQLGAPHATTPTAQTISAHPVTTGTGAALTLQGGAGSVARGQVNLKGASVNFEDQTAAADVAVASTHSVTLKVGGTSYKFLLATP